VEFMIIGHKRTEKVIINCTIIPETDVGTGQVQAEVDPLSVLQPGSLPPDVDPAAAPAPAVAPVPAVAPAPGDDVYDFILEGEPVRDLEIADVGKIYSAEWDPSDILKHIGLNSSITLAKGVEHYIYEKFSVKPRAAKIPEVLKQGGDERDPLNCYYYSNAILYSLNIFLKEGGAALETAKEGLETKLVELDCVRYSQSRGKWIFESDVHLTKDTFFKLGNLILELIIHCIDTGLTPPHQGGGGLVGGGKPTHLLFTPTSSSPSMVDYINKFFADISLGPLPTERTPPYRIPYDRLNLIMYLCNYDKHIGYVNYKINIEEAAPAPDVMEEEGGQGGGGRLYTNKKTIKKTRRKKN
jgi:hypothetical protein